MPSLPHHNFRLTGQRWHILVEGDERAIPWGPNERKGLDYLAARLLNGESVALEALEHYGIRVRYPGDNVEIIEVPEHYGSSVAAQGMEALEHALADAHFLGDKSAIGRSAFGDQLI